MEILPDIAYAWDLLTKAPLRLRSWRRGEKMLLTRNPDYYLKKQWIRGYALSPVAGIPLEDIIIKPHD